MPPGRAVTLNSDDALIGQYLAGHEAPCPSCGYNLHRNSGSRCPECGRSLMLTLGERSSLGGRRFLLLLILLFLTLAGTLDGVREGIAIHRQATTQTRQSYFTRLGSPISTLVVIPGLSQAPSGDAPEAAQGIEPNTADTGPLSDAAAANEAAPAPSVQAPTTRWQGRSARGPRRIGASQSGQAALDLSLVRWRNWMGLGVAITVVVVAASGLVLLARNHHRVASPRAARALFWLTSAGLAVYLLPTAIALIERI